MGVGAPRHAPSVGKSRPPLAGTLWDLTGRVILVTGASRGLGASMAQALAEAGASLILWGRDVRALTRQTTRIRRSLPRAAGAQASPASSRVILQRVDVTQPPMVHRAVRSALRVFGHIDVLINNAGIWGGDEALRLPRRVWHEVIETDLTSVFFVSQAVVPSMIRRRYGKIINVASTAGVMALPHAAAYGSAKAGLFHLTRILAVEWGPYGVRVTGIAPGLFRTAMTRELFADRRWSRMRQAEIPLRRFGEPDDLEGLVVFLASSASDHITGQTIIIDGGASLTT